MKSKDQQLLEEAYGKVRLNNYGMPNVKSKGKPLSPYDDSARLAAKREEQNAGLEDDVETFREPYTPHASQTAPAASTPKPEQPINVDLSKLAGKKINAEVWDYPDYVITVGQKPIGTMLSKADAERIVGVLNSKDGESLGTPLFQNWYKSAVKDLQ